MPLDMIVNFGVIGILFYMRYVDNKKSKFYEGVIQNLQTDRIELIKVIQENTKAFTKFADTVTENRQTIETLQHNCEIRHGKVLKEIKKNDNTDSR